ncbi:hypothetical protein HS125_03830 [bacterium]|nr:hypothetical protein [bacterium]
MEITNDPTTGRITVADTENLKRRGALNTVNEVTGDADQIRKYTIRIGNLWDVTDTIYRILMADPQAQSRRIYIDTTQLGQINRFGSIGGGRAQGVRYQPLITQRGQQDRSVTTTLGVESDLDIYDALFFPDPRTHTLFVRSRDPILFDRVQTLVGLLDIPPKMLEVEARLVEVALTELRSIGIDWSLTGIGRSGLNLTDFENVDFTADAMNQSAEGLLLNFATLGETQLTTVLSLISTLNSAEVLSAPRMITRSAPSEVPQINVSTLTPYIDQVEIVSDGDDDPTNNRLNVTYQQVEVGVLMSFYPLVTADNHVYLDIYPRISVVTDRLPVTIQNLGAVGGSAAQAEQFTGLGIPVIDSRESFNEVFLNNGETLVLGGLIRDELQTVENRVPLLHRLPIFGPLFKEQGKTKTKRTLLIFVTVNVLPTR